MADFADVDKAVLMDADIDEGTELGDVGDDAFEDHADGDIPHFLDVFAEGGDDELIAGVAAGFTEFLADIVEGEDADFLGLEAFHFDLLDYLGFGDEFGDGEAEGGGDGFDDRVGLGVDGGHIEGVFAVADAEEAGGLFEGFGAEAGDGHELDAALEATVFIAELDDLLGDAFGEAGDLLEERGGGGVEIDADAVDAAFDGLFEALFEAALVDVVLILADADGFGVDFDEFGEGILEAAGDGDGAADGEVKIRELLAGDVGGGIDGGSGFGDDDAEGAEVGGFDDVGDFAGAGAVADGEGLDVMLLDEPGEGFDGAGDILLGFEGIDDGMFE